MLERLFPREESRERSEVLGRLPGFVEALWWDAASRRLISADAAGGLVAWAEAEGWQRAARATVSHQAITGLVGVGGRRLLALGREPWPRLVALPDLEPVGALEGHAGEVVAADYDPISGRILTGSHDQTACCWDAASGRRLWQTPPQSFWTSQVAWLSDGSAAVLVSFGGVFRVRAGDGVVGERLGPEAVSPRCMAVDRARARLWLGGVGEVALVSTTGRETEVVIAVPSECRTLVLLGDGGVLYCGVGGEVGVIAEGRLSLLGAHGGAATGGVDLGAGRVATWGLDGVVRAWDRASGGGQLDQHADHTNIPLSGVVVDGAVITGGADDRIRRWRPDPEDATPEEVPQRGLITSLRFAEDGTLLATDTGQDGCRLWRPGARKLRTLRGNGDSSGAVLLGDRVVVAGDDNKLQVHSRQGRHLHTVGYHGIRHVLRRGDELLAAFMDGAVRCLSLSDPRQVRWEASPLGGGDIFHLALCPAGLLCAGKGVAVLDPDDGAVLRRFSGHSQPVQVVRVLDAGRVISLSRADGRALVWDPATGESRGALPVNRYVDLHVRGERLYASINGGGLEVWSLDLSERLAAIAVAAEGYPTGLQSAPGFLTVSCSERVVRLALDGAGLPAGPRLEVVPDRKYSTTHASNADGWLAVATDRELVLYDAAGTPVVRRPGRWDAVAFGARLLFAASQAELVALDPWSGAVRWRAEEAHGSTVGGLLPLPDGGVASYDWGGILRVVDAGGGVRHTLGGLGGRPYGIEPVPGGAVAWAYSGVVLGLDAEGRERWRLETRRKLHRGTLAGPSHVLIGHDEGALLVSAEGERVGEWALGDVVATASGPGWAAAGCRGGEVGIWRCPEGDGSPPSLHMRTSVEVEVNGIAWHPARAELIISVRWALWRWTPSGLQAICELPEEARAIAVMADGQIAVGLYGGAVLLLSPEGEVRDQARLRARVWTMARRGDRLAAGDTDGGIYVWRVAGR